MSKQAQGRFLGDNQALATNTMIRGSSRKLNLLAQLIRGKDVNQALVDLEFSPKAMAKDVRKVLLSAIANAESNHNLDIGLLVVHEATVGKALVMKRFRARAKGRAGPIKKPFSKIRIVVEQLEEIV